MTQDMKKDTILHRIAKRMEPNVHTWKQKDSQGGNQLFPAWESIVPSMGINNSHKGYFLRSLILLLVMLVLGVNSAWAFDEGLYYIKSNANTAYYLCPSIGCYYGNDVDQPHLTTFKTNGDQYSIWKIVPVEGETDTYYIIHYKTGRYLKSNEDLTTVEGGTTKHNRKAVHLEVKPATLTDDFKFLIKNSSSPYQIYPKVYWNTDVAKMSFNPTNEHQDCYAPADGAVTNGGAKGMIGLFDKNNAYSKWQIPSVASAPCATPIIKYDGDNINISYPYSDEAGITIYYTTDGSDPTISSPHEESNSFNIPASGVVKVRAIATKTDFVNSDEAVLWGSARPFLIQSKECADYYLVPAGDGTNINTSSLPGTSMQWTLQNAGASTGGVQYYYVVNSNNKKINYNSDYTLTLNDASVDANKFCVLENGYGTGYFFLIPVSQTDRVLYKAKGNVESNNCNADLNKKWDTNLDQWNLRVCNETADQKNLFSAAPFSVSNDDETHFYHIASVGQEGYYIVPPAEADGYATTSNTGYGDTPWLFKVAASDNWLTYYYIINAASGKYMYFNPNNNQTGDQENVISLKEISEKNAENEEKFQFIMVRSTTTGACYIVPKGYSYADASHKNFHNNEYFGLWANESGPLKSTWSRISTGNHVKWTFEEATIINLYLDPVISQDENGYISITHPTVACDLYYTVDGTTDPVIPAVGEDPVAPTLEYNGPFLPPLGTTKIKAKAVIKGDHSIVSGVVEYDFPPLTPPTITFDNTSNTVTITSLTGATIYYAYGSTDPTDPIVDENVAHGSSPITFSISDKTYIKAIAIKEGFTTSAVQSTTIDKVPSPVISSVSPDGKVTLSCATEGAVIYYTIGDSEPTDPTTASTRYNNPIENAGGNYIKAIAVKDGWIKSDVFTSSQIRVTCALPVIKRETGDRFSISCSFPLSGVHIYYTTGSTTPADPTSGSSEYEEPVSISSYPIVVKAIAIADGYDDSAIAELTIDEGLATDGTYYEIASAGDFEIFVTMANTAEGAGLNYRVTDDFSVSGTTAIDQQAFTGIFDGNNHTITDLSHPLFNTVNGGVVKNIILDNVSISGGTNVGAIANKVIGTSSKMGRIYNCGVLSGSVSGSGYVGSIVGQLGDSNNDNCYARVINCFSYATVSGGSDVGGLVGYNDYATTATDIRTMVMNCMFYGDITGGTNKSPVYGGENINNLQGGLNTFNYYAYEQLPTSHITSGKYNCALAVEDKYLNRFEFYRLLLNSNKKLAAFYATGSHNNANEMAKWVLETADRTITNPKPYPVLKAQGYYPSIINPDFENAPDSASVGRNKGGKLGKTLSVTIATSKSDGGQSWPADASISTTSLTLQRTDKDFDRFNYNYDKVQLPYYNDVGSGNYTGNRVVTGWKITAITAVDDDPYTSANYDYTKTYASNADYFEYPNYNFADRKSSNKDLYSVSGRVFSQGAYFDVPYGVTSITIEPYWGKACYIADENYDVVYKNDYSGKQQVTQTGTQVTVGTTKFNEQDVQKSIEPALNYIANSLDGLGPTVYDNALVLVGNLHLDVVPLNGDRPFTMMSVDTDNDHEPDYSLIYHHKSRSNMTPIRFDFLAVPGTAQAQKPNGASLICNFTIFKTRGWFEVTNTAFMYSSQIEYENGDLGEGVTKIDAPLILLGGIFDQFVSTQTSKVNGKTIYIHVGSNVWINEFGMGTHSDGAQSTPHVPVSVTGGEFPGFYLTGTYKADAAVRKDNAECYISGGYFHEAAGASLEQIDGNVRWQIYNADIDNFFGGGINEAKPIKGDVTVDIYNSNVTLFCGGPKFGNMQPNKKVTTNAEGCTFGKFFGAGYGGTSLAKKKYYDLDTYNWTTLQGYFTSDRGNYFDGTTTGASQVNGKDYGKKGPGVATDFDYEFFVWTSGATGARFYINFAAFSLAQCNDVESNLKNCVIETNFYGGGNLGKVVGTATSVLEDCTVNGSVYGAGYSASLPTVEVRNAGFTTNPNYNSQSGMFEPGVFSGTTTFTWQNATAAGKTLTNGGSGSDLTNHILYTNVELTNLGEVANSNLTIKGTTTVGESVYGGGEESGVGGDTEVTVSGGIIGTDGQGGATYGNVYGGGMGKAKNEVGENYDDLTLVKAGLVKGNTNVTINGGDILHNVYGGGAFGSVGTYTYDASGNITAYTSGGTANITITGGTIGTSGIDNGMVFGSSRGDVDEPGSIQDRLAWVHDTHVIIGTSGKGTTLTTPLIKGSVYGSGENGHTYQNTIVDVHSGTIGIPTGDNVVVHDPDDPENTEKDVTYAAYNYPYRGNVYGSGCGTDKYYSSGTAPQGHTLNDGKGDTYNPLSGIVLGTATVNIDGGQVVHNVYGAGAMGSVGITDNTGAITGGGSTTVTISGGIVGVTVTVDNDHPEPTGGNVFGAARGDVNAPKGLAQVKSTSVSMSNGIVYGNVYGGGALGDVGTYTNTYTDSGSKNYVWDKINNIEIGDCAVEISGGTVWGHVFGAGQGDASTFECEKAMVRKTDVSISAGTVKKNVYGGGEVGRVDQNTKVTIGDKGADETGAGTSGAASAPVIEGDVFGAGAGKETHGYSALVRGNAEVIVQGKAEIAKSVYGGGEIAAVGRYGLDGDNMPTNLVSGGECKVTVMGYAKVGTDSGGGNVFGAGKGVNPFDADHTNNIDFTTPTDMTTKPKRMTLKPTGDKPWPEHYTEIAGTNYIWEYYTSQEDYFKFLQTLALATDTKVSINGQASVTTVNGSVYGGSESGFVQRDTEVEIRAGEIGTTTTGANVYGGGKGLSGFDDAGRVSGGTTIAINGGTTYGSVFGGGELGFVKGAVLVNMNDGEIKKDVYGGGALANTNTNNWDGSALSETYQEVSGLTIDESSVVGYYTESSGTYTKVTSGTAGADTKYYRKVNTTVNLLGGEIHGDAYGGGLGRLGVTEVTGVHYTAEEANTYNTEHNLHEGDPGYVTTESWKVAPVTGVTPIPATVYGDITVQLGDDTLDPNTNTPAPVNATKFYITKYEPQGIVKSGRVFGCNNLNGSPQGNVKVDVWKTVTGNVLRTTGTAKANNKIIKKNNPDTYESVEGYVSPTYEVAAVYGGGNLANYAPSASGKKANVIIETCDVSIESVYGGGNAAEVPATDVLVNGAYEIEEVFGGGNGKDPYTTDDGTSWVENPGANIGNATHSGSATTLMTGGLIHAAYGGSNKKGTIFGSVSIDIGEGGDCTLDLEKMVGAGKDADVNGDLIMVLGCKPGETIPVVYGGADNAHVNGNVELTITSGRYEKVFGGNNQGGYILGHIKLNIEEGSCDTPIEIDHLYLGGNEAAYSQYGYYQDGTEIIPRTAEMAADGVNHKDVITTINGANVRRQPDATTNSYAQPELNIISCTYIGEVFGGGYGSRATLYGNPVVNINMVPGPKAATNITRNGGNNAHALGEIGNVFGGGEGADVYGNTTVNIGQSEYVKMTSFDKLDVRNYYTRSESAGSYTYTMVTGETAVPATDNTSYYKKVEGAYITGNVYGGGKLANVGKTHLSTDNEGNTIDVIDITGNTFVNIGAVKGSAILGTDNNPTGEYNYTPVYIEATTANHYEGVTIAGNVYGGGKGEAAASGDGAFRCGKAMVTGGTNICIGNGTVAGTVYGGGEVGRVEVDTRVTIGLGDGTGTTTSAPVIAGDIFGAGAGVNTHGYSALVRGNSYVTVQGDAKVGKSVYGGGEIASVGRYSVAKKADLDNPTWVAAHPGVEEGMPYTTNVGGNCTVTVQGNAEIGPDDMKMYHSEITDGTDKPDDTGHVFGAGKGVLPYADLGTEVIDQATVAGRPRRITPGNVMEYYTKELYTPKGEETYLDAYLLYIESLALATQTDVTIGGNAFVKGSVYGGSENGHVQKDTHVTIEGGCQIGAGYNATTGHSVDKYSNWPTDAHSIETSWYECAHWDYDANSGASYDPYATHLRDDGKYYYYASGTTQYLNPDDGKYYADTEYTLPIYAEGGSSVAKDGHTYYGNVFGGGSGVVPYAPGQWHRAAGSVGGNTVVDITGGHILTSVYGGNEQTDVGTYTKDSKGALVVPATGGKCTINMVGGTLGVPRTEDDMKAHPVTCYLFGAGKGDQRIFFNTWTNVINTEVNISGDARIYGSTFGGGEDGHIIRDAKTNIGGSVTIGETTYTNQGVIIGTTGTSYVDGNVFGGGRGFSGEAQTAGTVGGNVEVNISGGTMLGSIYGGGRLASVGTQFTAVEDPNYGSFIEDETGENAKTYGHVTINISGGTIGNGTGNNVVADKDDNIVSGNVFGGSMGRLKLLDGNTINPIWPKMAQVKSTVVNVYGTAKVKRNVYGGGELGTVRDDTYVTIGGQKTADADENGVVAISKDDNCTAVVRRDVYGGGYGSEDFNTKTFITVKEAKVENPSNASDYDDVDYVFTPMIFAGCVGKNTYVNVVNGQVSKSVYGGGEMASVGIIDCTVEENSSATDPVYTDNINNKKYVYKKNHKHDNENNDFILSWPYHFENHDGFFGDTHVNITGGRVGVTANDDDINTDNGDVYGGGKGIAGDFNNYVFCANVGSTDVKIDINSSVTPANYMSGGDCITGAVYGGAENGHVMGNTKLTLNKGLVGHSIYGGGSGKGMFMTTLTKIPEGRVKVLDNKATTPAATPPTQTTDKYDAKIYSITAGKVFGNTEVIMNGGYVVRNVYGGGNLGSVGKGNYAGGPDDYSTAGYGEKISGDNRLWTNDNPYSQAFLSSGKSTVKIYGGNVGYIDFKNASAYTYSGLPYGNVFGGCRGVSAPNVLETPRYLYCPSFFSGYVNETEVIIGDPTNTTEGYTGPSIAGSVYGGGMDGHVRRDTKVTVNSGEIGRSYNGTGSDLTNPEWLHCGNIYGSGSGMGKYEYDFNYDGDYEDKVEYTNINNKISTLYERDFSTSAGSVSRFTMVEIKGGIIHHNVYGGGSLSTVGPPKIPPITDDPLSRNDTDTNTKGKQAQNTVTISGGHIGDASSYDANGNNIYGGNVYAGSRGESDLGTSFANANYTVMNIETGADIKGSVFGGGEAGIVKNNVVVNMNGGTVMHDVYGGGALANTNTSNWNAVSNAWADATNKSTVYTTTVNLHGGTIGHNAYGGGLGRKDVTVTTPAQGTEGQDGYVAPSTSTTPGVPALVYGDVLVKLNETPTVTTEGVANFPDNCVVKGVIHGANNYNGSPQGDVTVHVYKTQGWTDDNGTPEDASDDISHDVTKGKNNENIEKDDRKYELKAVYGGGNEAAYDPKDDQTRKAHVIIEGCNLTSIQTVYGGGNAAAAPATHVEVNSCYEISTVFAGGNGKDKLSDGITENPGADVGLIALKDGGTPYANDPTKQVYGTGVALAEIHGGFVHSAFGGSNTKGNVRTSATVELSEPDVVTCPLGIDEAYGAGNEAAQDGTSNIDLGCLSYLRELYGGAKNADVNNDIVLNIQSGHFHRVFGGNNIGGQINGSITVNIEETGCHPIVIGQLFGGGNKAGYSVYGYKPELNSDGTIKTDANGKTCWLPFEKNDAAVTVAGTTYSPRNETVKFTDPQVNVKSFTSIGEIYGGGYGNSAVIVGNPIVDINVCEGENRTVDITGDLEDMEHPGQNVMDETNQPIKVSANTGKWIHILAGKDDQGENIYNTVWQPEHKSGAIGTIGNVFGGGNAAPVHGNTNVIIGDKNTVVFETPKKKTVTTNGVTSEVDTTDQERTHTVIGANITGNVYGGGNAADVSGDTNVVIGKEKTTTTTTP